jgi:hypothetical protein
MSLDRQIANALSEGINCIAALAAAAGESTISAAPSSADPSWPDTLRELEHALNAIRGGAVTTSLDVRDEDLERSRRLQGLVEVWLQQGHPPEGLGALAGEMLESLALTGSSGPRSGS